MLSLFRTWWFTTTPPECTVDYTTGELRYGKLRLLALEWYYRPADDLLNRLLKSTKVWWQTPEDRQAHESKLRDVIAKARATAVSDQCCWVPCAQPPGEWDGVNEVRYLSGFRVRNWLNRSTAELVDGMLQEYVRYLGHLHTDSLDEVRALLEFAVESLKEPHRPNIAYNHNYEAVFYGGTSWSSAGMALDDIVKSILRDIRQQRNDKEITPAREAIIRASVRNALDEHASAVAVELTPFTRHNVTIDDDDGTLRWKRWTFREYKWRDKTTHAAASEWIAEIRADGRYVPEGSVTVLTELICQLKKDYSNKMAEQEAEYKKREAVKREREARELREEIKNTFVRVNSPKLTPAGVVVYAGHHYYLDQIERWSQHQGTIILLVRGVGTVAIHLPNTVLDNGGWTSWSILADDSVVREHYAELCGQLADVWGKVLGMPPAQLDSPEQEREN